MTLCDASPLVALINSKDEGHSRCMTLLPNLSGPLVTTWPCFTEAMYLLSHYGGYPAQSALWGYVRDEALIFHDLDQLEQRRMATLMERYRDRPMDLADASLVAAAETRKLKWIFTLDGDFYIYRYRDTGIFEVVPGPA